MHSYIHIHILTYTQIFMHVSTDTYLHGNMHAKPMYIWLHTEIHACVYKYAYIFIWKHACIDTYINTYICTDSWMCVHALKHTCMHAYTHTHRYSCMSLHKICIHTPICVWLHTFIYMYIQTYRDI